jgi:hypothetical protein
MPGKDTRRVEYDAVTDRWPRFLINTPQPDRVLAWIAGHLSGPWSYRIVGSAEFVELIGEVPDGHVVFLLAFAEESDAAAFELRHAVPAGRA